jgi:hypothetical protein
MVCRRRPTPAAPTARWADCHRRAAPRQARPGPHRACTTHRGRPRAAFTCPGRSGPLITFSVMSTRGLAKTTSCRIRSYFSVSKICLMTRWRARRRWRFFIAALVQVFLEFAALALQVTVLFDQFTLAAAALAFGQRRRVLLQLVGSGLERRPGRSGPCSRLLKSASSLASARLGRCGLAHHALAVHVADLEFLCSHSGVSSARPISKDMATDRAST